MPVALGIQSEISMCHVVTCGLPVLHTFPRCLTNAKIFFKKKWFLKTNLFWIAFTNFCETFLVLKRTERDMIKKMYISLHVKYLLFLSDFNEN